MKRVQTGSLIDRLIEHPESGRGDEAFSVARLREGLRRDLQALLNTRRRMLSWREEWEELDRSLVNYGLSDFTNDSLASIDFRAEFIDHVESVVRRLEPRISAFDVSLLNNPDPLDRTLRFRITGVVVLGSERQELAFDSHVDPVTGGVVMRD